MEPLNAFSVIDILWKKLCQSRHLIWFRDHRKPGGEEHQSWRVAGREHVLRINFVLMVEQPFKRKGSPLYRRHASGGMRGRFFLRAIRGGDPDFVRGGSCRDIDKNIRIVGCALSSKRWGGKSAHEDDLKKEKHG